MAITVLQNSSAIAPPVPRSRQVCTGASPAAACWFRSSPCCPSWMAPWKLQLETAHTNTPAFPPQSLPSLLPTSGCAVPVPAHPALGFVLLPCASLGLGSVLLPCQCTDPQTAPAVRALYHALGQPPDRLPLKGKFFLSLQTRAVHRTPHTSEGTNSKLTHALQALNYSPSLWPGCSFCQAVTQ